MRYSIKFSMLLLRTWKRNVRTFRGTSPIDSSQRFILRVRFYFLSDEELLEILSQTRNPMAVQPHLRKCFEGINRLEFAAKGGEDMEMTVTMAPEIRAMLSPEGERVEVLKVKATGNVEDWLKQVEKNMITAVRTCIKKAKDDFEKSVREEWLVRHAHQVREVMLRDS